MLERLKRLETNIVELTKFRKEITLHDVMHDKTKEWALRYGLLEAIQIVIDIACYVVSKYNLGNPETYAECIELLQKNGYINNTLAMKLKGMVGLRNILVHEYIEVQPQKLYDLLEKLDDFKKFITSVKEYL